MIVNANILDWAAQYEGPLFHALFCDPPYHLTEITKRFGKPSSAPAQHGTDGAFQRASKGFMGRSWDGGDLAFQPETWAMLAELLHPGAFLMAFAGSRGYHRMACAIEDAGFIIHPAIGWAFGCLSEDTEILTTNGWEPYRTSIANSTVMCYNPDIDALEWHRVQELVAYDYDETAYRIHSANTDQIVSRNHRCLVDRGGRWVFELAEYLRPVERIPVTTEAQIQAAQPLSGREAHRQDHHMPDMRHAGVQATGMAQEGARYADMRQCVPWYSTIAKSRDTRASQKHQRQRQGQKAARQGVGRRGESGMEGRRHLLQDTWQLHRRKVCTLPGGIHQHGPQGWLRDGAPSTRGSGARPPVVASRGRTSYRPQPSQQRSEQLAAVRQQSRSQASRASRVASPDLATVTPIHYHGVVWCVRVPTGAFVARRNGHIFITGNSGFPKATRIDTQVDRRAGAERETVGARRHQPKFAAKDFGYRQKDNGFNSRDRESFDVTAPATELAQAWQGHRYGLQAMKPAFEFICVAQKPYQGQPVECITRTGAGALWIDGGRIGSADDMNPRDFDDSRRTFPKFNGMYNSGRRGQYRNAQGIAPAGRWPSNLILDEHTATLIGAQSGESESKRSDRDKVEIFDELYKRAPSWHGESTERGHDDSGTAARFFFQVDYMAERLEATDPLFYCAKADRSEREAGLDPRQIALLGTEELQETQEAPVYVDKKWSGSILRRCPEHNGTIASGSTVYTCGCPHQYAPRHGFAESTINDGREKPIDNPYQRGETTRRNVHPTIKPLSLCRYLSALLLPPALYAPRRLLVPFCGAASEYIGALLAGWEEIVGVELEADYCRIGEARVAYWQQRRHEFLDPSKPIDAKVSAAPAGQRDMFMEDL